jgi:hypothetical protein
MSILAQTTTDANGEPNLVVLVIALVLLIIEIAGMWKVFTKAGKAGWQSIIPIWNIVVLLRIVGRPVWWIILMLIPIVNIIVWIVVSFDLAKSFGKGIGFGLGLAFLGFIFVPILGFGDARYQRAYARR